MLSDHIRAMQRVCFSKEPTDADLEHLGSKERWLVYRKLVRQRLRHVVGASMPRTKEALGGEAFESAVEDWLSDGGPSTRYFRHVPAEFHAHASERWKHSAPSWVTSLAAYELARWNVRYAASSREEPEEFTFERVPLLNPALELLRLRHAVHETPTPTEGYPVAETTLCVYRDEHHRPVSWTLNPLAASLVDEWMRGEMTVAQSVQEVAAAHGVEIGPAFVDKLSTMIADFLTRGILLGSRAAR